MSQARSGKIQVSRALLASLVLSLVGCLMVMAFLLGRQTAPNQAPAVTAPASPPSLTLSPEPVAVAPQAVAPPPPRPVLHRRHPAAQMLQYLNRIDSIMASTGELGDPTEFATGLLGQAAAGDASGFDDLLAKTRKARARLAGIQPPGSCMEHYRLTMRELSDSITLLKAVKRAIISMDSASLPELAIRGQALQSRVERLQALTRRLREHGR